MVISPSEIPLNLNPSIAVSGQLDIGNLGSTVLSGIKATVENATSNINIQIIAPPDLNRMQTGKINYTVIASDESILRNSPTIRFTSDEGEEATITFDIRVIPRHPNLEVSPGYLEAGMLRGTQTLVECEISNNGAVPAYDVGVQLPAVPWMTLVTPENVGTILAGEKRKIVLSLTPPADIQLGPYTGNISVFGSNTSLSIGFRFTAISDKVGGLRITAKDEFTYFADDHPPVSAAKVELKDVSTGQVLVSGVTDTNGVCEMPQLLEGYYNLEVSADKHGTYRSTEEVSSGQLKEVRAFLPRQLVTYTWTVVPIEIEDRYDVHLEAVFETHVPAPVVTVDPMVLDVRKLNFDDNGQAIVIYTVTNHGLIGVDNLALQFGEHPDYSIMPSIEQLGRLNGLSSIVVPVTVTKQVVPAQITSKSEKLSYLSGTQTTSTSPCSFSGVVRFTFMCGNDIELGSVALMITVNTCIGPMGPISPPRDPCGGVVPGYPYKPDKPGPGPVWNPVYSQPKTCSECVNNLLSGCALDILLHFVPLNCEGTAFLDGFSCGYECASSGPNEDCVFECTTGLLDTAAECVAKDTPILGWIITGAKCLHDLSGCFTIQVDIGTLSHGKSGPAITDNPADVQAHRLFAIGDAFAEIFGSDLWLSGNPSEADKFDNWLRKFHDATLPNSENGPHVSESERSDLMITPLPSQLTAYDAKKFLDRWNRTLDYWKAGIFNTQDVPSSQSTDFITADAMAAKFEAAANAIQANLSDGFTGLMDGADYVYRSALNKTAEGPEDGVCARVRIRIDQQVAITRSAFKATLEVENAPKNVELQNVRVTLDIRDSNSANSNDKFGIRTPELTNISDFNGGGTISPGTTASANWVIIPTRDAAPDALTQYYVSGTLEYDQGGTHVTIPLFPAPILVKPDPLLLLDYFLVRNVYSDDPFTPEIEPAEPFSLGLLMANHGKGLAKNVRITSSQPQIVENEKGLLIDFKIIGSQVNSEQVSPSLTMNLGDIGAGDTSVAQWIMTCSLQGKFIEYKATFEHIDELGNERLSLIDSVNIHELTHVVRVDVPADDGKPDFLVNDVPDSNYLPDILYCSDGSTAVVNVGVNATIDESVTTTNLQVHLDVTVPSGWIYIRASDPGMDQFRLVRVVRSDGREIMVRDNAWTTHRTIRLVGQSPYRENLLHIFDKNSSGSYTLIYEEIAPDVTTPTSAVSPLPVEQTSNIFTVCWSGEDNVGGSGLKDFDIYVSDNGGPWQPWLSNIIIRCASFVGQLGHTYSFYSIARDIAGNVETSPLEPDAITRVLIIAPPQANYVAGYLDANTQTYRFAVTYTDSEAINVSSLSDGDIRVSGPNGFVQSVKYVDVDINNNGSPRTARYMFTAPGGTWESTDNGIYTLFTESSQVSNTRGNYVAGGILKTFKITDNLAGELVLESYNLIKQTRIGRTLFDYEFTVTLYNSNPVAISGVNFELFNAPANMTIIDSNVTFAHIKAGETATSAGTMTVRVNRTSTTNLYSVPWRVTFEPGILFGDFTGDGKVDLDDLSVFATYWLTDEPSKDIAPSQQPDGIINFLDLAVFAQQWMSSSY
jgi:hypothetical protein